MTEQLALDGVTSNIRRNPEPKPREGNQQHAFDYIRANDGVTAEQIGAHLHSTRDTRPHPASEPCQWCEKTGKQTAESKGLSPLVTYSNVDGKRVYRVRRPADRIRNEPIESIVEPTEAQLASDPFVGL